MASPQAQRSHSSRSSKRTGSGGERGDCTIALPKRRGTKARRSLKPAASKAGSEHPRQKGLQSATAPSWPPGSHWTMPIIAPPEGSRSDVSAAFADYDVFVFWLRCIQVLRRLGIPLWQVAGRPLRKRQKSRRALWSPGSRLVAHRGRAWRSFFGLSALRRNLFTQRFNHLFPAVLKDEFTTVSEGHEPRIALRCLLL